MIMKQIIEARWFCVIALICSVAVTTTCFMLIITRNIPIAWVFGIPTAITSSILAWQATRSDEWYQLRLDKQIVWPKNHPYLSASTILATMILFVLYLLRFLLNKM